ncbi:MAG: D-glycerate dehydrogenase [Dehalococcoidia bacterium]
MPRPRVFVTRNLPGNALDLLRDACSVTVWPGEMPPSPDDLRREAASAHGLVTLLTDRVDDALLAAAPQLVAVSNMATGFDNIDVAAASQHLVLVARTPGVLTETSADLAFGLLLAAARRIAEGDRYVRAGKWRTWGPETMLGPDVHGATLGIVGLGRIGTAVARRAAGFGMRTLYHSRERKQDAERELGAEYASLDELLRESDFVSLHSALTNETRGLIGARELGLMKPTAILVNTARGPLVDQAALYEALRSGTIAGAALDVTDPEPLPADSPLLTLENIVITPHIASASVATRSEMARLAAENLLACVRGEVNENVVNAEIADEWRDTYARRVSV